MSSTNSPKVSTNNTRTPTPTQNGIPQSFQMSGTGSSGSGAAAAAAAAVAAATTNTNSSTGGAGAAGALDPQSQSKYQQLLSVIEEMSKDIRPTYAGSKSSAERLKRGIVYARILVSVTYSNNSRFQLFLINLHYSFR